MIPIKQIKEFMKQMDIDMNEEQIKKMNEANEFYKYIESGRAPVVFRPNVRSKKEISEHRICSKQRKAIIHE
jgi:hypothetical protein